MVEKNVAIDNLNAAKDALREAEAARKVSMLYALSLLGAVASPTRRDSFYKVAMRLQFPETTTDSSIGYISVHVFWNGWV